MALTIKKLPQGPGIYFFKSASGKILYIGKAINIKKRVQSHFSKPSFKKVHFDFLKEVKKIDFKVTDSEIEALLLEAAMIKKHSPPHNVAWKDDKNYFYIGITNEKYPRVFLTHQPLTKNLEYRSWNLGTKKKGQKNLNSKFRILHSSYIGPFVDGKALKITLRYLRRAFPYRVCGKIPHRTCMWFDIHKKESPCRGTIDPKEYQKHIRHFVQFIEGKKKRVLGILIREMKRYSKSEGFEKAAEVRDQIHAIQNVASHSHIFSQGKIASHVALRELKQIFRLEATPQRIEGYDISNIQGKDATGSMVVFIDGEPAKEHYRKFKIKISGIPNDTAMHNELMRRRVKHKEWSYPDLILIDGGLGQLRSARAALGLEGYKRKFTIAGLAKRQNLLYLETPFDATQGKQKNPIPMSTIPQAARNLLTYIRDESHRFAITYHRKLHRKQFQKTL